MLGLLGPNGAGKTTVVRILTTLLRARRRPGRRSPGIDVVARRRRACAGSIGLSGQYAAVDEYLTGLENLDMVGRLYHLGRGASRGAGRRAARAVRPRRRRATGRRRPTPAACAAGSTSPAALIARPPVLFLDEPTTGLDPRSRLGMWEVIADLVAGGTTLLLTTQYLEEADRLADRSSSSTTAGSSPAGTADELKAQVGGERLEFTLADAGAARRRLRARCASLGGRRRRRSTSRRRRLTVPVRGGADGAASRRCAGSTPPASTCTTSGCAGPTLDDVFLSLTGHAGRGRPTADDEPPTSRTTATSDEEVAAR